MKRWLPFVVPFVLIVVVGISTLVWSTDDLFGHPEPIETTFEDLDPALPWVKIEVMAHYAAMVTQKTPATLLSEEKVMYLFAAFPRYNTEERAVPVLVRTARPPDRLVSYEIMTVEGRLSYPTSKQVPFNTEELMGKRTDYYFSDSVMLLEPIRIHTEDGVFEEP